MLRLHMTENISFTVILQIKCVYISKKQFMSSPKLVYTELCEYFTQYL